MDESREERYKRRKRMLERNLTMEEKREASAFDSFEQGSIADMMERGMDFKKAVVVYSNGVEGDLSQLSPAMRSAYRKYKAEMRNR